jgi:hypothetical protein
LTLCSGSSPPPSCKVFLTFGCSMFTIPICYEKTTKKLFGIA